MFLFRHSDEAPEKGIPHADPGAPETRGTKRNAAARPDSMRSPSLPRAEGPSGCGREPGTPERGTASCNQRLNHSSRVGGGVTNREKGSHSLGGLRSTPPWITDTGRSEDTTTTIKFEFSEVNRRAELNLAPRARSSVLMKRPSSRQAKAWR